MSLVQIQVANMGRLSLPKVREAVAMAITIEVRVNGNLVAEAMANNISELADVSDYKCTARERGKPSLGIEDSEVDFELRGYERKQSVWGIVEKIAERALDGG